MRRPRPFPAAAAALLAAFAAGCVTETRTAGIDPADSAARAGWNVAAGGGRDAAAEGGPRGVPSEGTFWDPPARPADQVVRVPASAYAPVDLFFDNEGYLLGDRIEIDCSFEPFRTRMVAASYDRLGDYVVREEGRDGDVVWVRLKNASTGAAYQANLVPLATFGSHRSPPVVVDPRTGEAVGVKTRPVFEFVGTEEILVRFHLNSPADRPVWFRARAVGTPSALDSSEPRQVIYTNVNRRRRAKGTDLSLSLQILRGGDGSWSPAIEDPGAGAGER